MIEHDDLGLVKIYGEKFDVLAGKNYIDEVKRGLIYFVKVKPRNDLMRTVLKKDFKTVKDANAFAVKISKNYR